MALWQWSKTATSNGTSDPTMNWSEGIPPSIVDDNVRALMARVAEWRDDTSGALVAAGTPPSYTVTTNEGFNTPTPTTGQLISWQPNITNVGSDTLAVDGGSAYPIQTSGGNAVTAGTLIALAPYTMMFTGTAWMLRNFFSSPFVVPIGGIIDWAGSSSPASNFVLPFGQAISRTTYSTLFSLVGTTYGVGDGVTTFNIPDLRGRISAGLDNMGGSAAGRIGTALVTDGGTINGQQLGSGGGSQSHTQASGELAIHNHSASSSDSGHTHGITLSSGNTTLWSTGTGSNTTLGGGSTSTEFDSLTINTGHASISTTVNNSSGGSAMAWLQPTLMLGKLLRVI